MFSFGKKKEKPMKQMKIQTYVYPTAPTSKIKQAVYKIIGYFKK
jgi:hypothetical protein|tara:strand:- start:1299 stop:1430 length:132 start_codon:yes stop_codon:yes gene_type:complete